MLVDSEKSTNPSALAETTTEIKMKTFSLIAIAALTLTLNFSAIGAEYQLAHGAAVGSEEPIEHFKDRIIWTGPSGEKVLATREYWVWATSVTEQAPGFPLTKTPTVRRRMHVVVKDMKGNVLHESGVAQPLGTTAPPDPEPVPVVINVCNYDPYGWGYSYNPYYWGGGGGYTGNMYTAGCNSAGDMGQVGGPQNVGGFNSVGTSVHAGGQFASGLNFQPGQSREVSTTRVGGGVRTGGGSAHVGRNSAGARSWNAGALLRVGELRREVHVVPIGNGERVQVYSNRPVPNHRRK